MQPPLTARLRVSPNVVLKVDDCEELWNFNTPFDFVHVRYMAGSIKDWPKLLRPSYESTAPGGWVQIMDFGSLYYSEDKTLTKDSHIHSWMTQRSDASK